MAAKRRYGRGREQTGWPDGSIIGLVEYLAVILDARGLLEPLEGRSATDIL